MVSKIGRWLVIGWFVGLFVSIVAIGIAAAGNETDGDYPFSILFITFKDISTDTVINGIPASITFSNLDLGTKTTITRFLDPDGANRFELRAGNWEIDVLADDQKTPEIDYYGKSIFLIENNVFVTNKTVYVNPTGSIQGYVIDRSQNRIKDADLQFKCKANGPFTYPAKTDQFGSFDLDVAPVGTCKISAAYQGKVGEEEIKIDHGKPTNAIVNLDNALVSQQVSWVSIIIGAALGIAAAGAFSYLHFKKRHGTAKSKAKEPEQVKQELTAEVIEEKRPPEELNPRARDIIATLKENEQAVVKFLLANENASTQAKLRNATGIPKTTLARIFQALEEKKVLSVEKIGKMKKVVLTEWFMGKE